MPATPESVWEFLEKLGQEIAELKESLREQSREIDWRFKETDREIRRTSREVRRLSKLFTTQWGKLVEALVEPGAVNLFRERGIQGRRTARRIEVEDEKGRKVAEFDIFLENDDELVVIEVKTTVKKEDVDYLLEKLSRLKEWCPRYKGCRIYGAVAGISFEEGVDRYAYRQGLFVLRSEGGIIRIANDPDFRPRVW